MWTLLLIAGLGNIGAVLLICIVPLFTQVALSAGLQGVLTGQPDGAQIVVYAYGGMPTQQSIASIRQRLDQLIAGDMGAYVTGGAQFSIALPDIVLRSGSTAATGKGALPADTLQVHGADIARVAQQYRLVEGRLPRASGDNLEIALPQADAEAIGAHVGTILHGQIPGQQPTSLDLHVVGIYAPSADAQAGTNPNSQSSVLAVGNTYARSALASNDTLLALIASHPQDPQYGPAPQLTWIYTLDTTRVSTNTLDDLLNRLGMAQTAVSGQLSGANGVQQIYLDAPAYRALHGFRIQTTVLQIPLVLLLLQVIALVLLFIRMMAEMLVDQQAGAIANLRSRGATRRQVFGSFTLHNIGLSLLALVVGPLAAIPLVRYLSLRSLPPASQGAVGIISGNPLAVAYSLRWYVLIAVVAVSVASIVSTNLAAGNNILLLRREAARTTTQPFWQRLNLDLIFGAISLIGYAGYMVVVRQVSPRIQLIISPLSLIAALVMLVAAALLFLRLLPLLLRTGSRLTTRGRGASSMLALTQLARVPKQPIRMTLLLALATGFTIFTLVYSASQAQRIVDVAAFQSGADFAGGVPASTAENADVTELRARYRQIPGVTSASLGYTANLDPTAVRAGIPVQVLAVDADTYATSALWTDQDSGQPLDGLMAQLAAKRPTAAYDGVPAILDDATWQAFHLTPGARFTLRPPGYEDQSMRFVAVARVYHIPGVYDSASGGGFSGVGGVLVDYQSYVVAYRHDLPTTAAPGVNAAWLATRDDAAALESVRQALTAGNLALDGLRDRRQLIADARNNPLQIDLANTLLIGAATALLLALVGIWVGSWLSARGRVVNFAVLRAVGATPRQLRTMLVWEQAIIYVAGLTLGIVLGWVLALTALPLLLFAELATSGNFDNVPNVPQARVIVPGSLLTLAGGALVAICAVALILTMGALARLSLGQTLRLNED
jgi:hypothetical protein